MDQPRPAGASPLPREDSGGSRPVPTGPGVTVARVLSGFGKTLIAAGVVILLFAAYQLWGTGLQERRSQGDLSEQFESTLAQVSATDLERLVTTTSSAPTSSSTPAPTTTAALPKEVVDLLYPPEGEPVAVLRIPKIGLEKVVVEGTGTEDLKRGPGRYEETPLPGQRGNAAIAGHRTTYGAPFYDIDQLVAGDEIRVTNVLGEVVYRVEGSMIVDPTDVDVVGDYGDNRITLTACHPKYSAAKRIVVWGKLVGEPRPTVPRPQPTDAAAPVTTVLPDDGSATSAPATTAASVPETTAAPATSAASSTSVTGADVSTTDGATTGATVATADDLEIAGLAGDGGAWPGTIGWGTATLALAAAAWFVARVLDRRHGARLLRRLGVYILASPLVLVTLYYCFVHVDRLLPAI